MRAALRPFAAGAGAQRTRRWRACTRRYSVDQAAGSAAQGPPFVEAQIVGKYLYDEKQLDVIRDFTKRMSGCGTAYAAVAIGNILLSAYQAQSHGFDAPEAIVGGLTVGDLAYWADSVLLWYLIRIGEAPFDAVLEDTENQLAHTFQGINRLTLVFQQLGIASITVSIVITLEAAAKWPPMVVAASIVFFVFAVMRSAAMWWVLNKHAGTLNDVQGTLRCMAKSESELPLLDRLAVRIAFGYLTALARPSTPDQDASTGAHANGVGNGVEGVDDAQDVKYQFTSSEETLISSMTDAVTTAGLGLGLQALATALLVVANVCVEDWSDGISSGINLVNKAAAATFIFTAAASFDQTLYGDPDDCDVQHFLMGLGEGGLTSLFEKLTVLAWAVAFAEGASLAAPWIEHSPLSTLVTEGAAERLADFFIRLLPRL